MAPAQIWVQSTYFVYLRLCAGVYQGELYVQQQISSFIPPTASGVEWTAAQAGIRKDGRINPDPNPGENVSDVARWKLAQHQKLGIWSLRPGKVSDISVNSFPGFAYLFLAI